MPSSYEFQVFSCLQSKIYLEVAWYDQAGNPSDLRLQTSAGLTSITSCDWRSAKSYWISEENGKVHGCLHKVGIVKVVFYIINVAFLHSQIANASLIGTQFLLVAIKKKNIKVLGIHKVLRKMIKRSKQVINGVSWIDGTTLKKFQRMILIPYGTRPDLYWGWFISTKSI